MRLPAAHLKILETIVMHSANSTTSSLLHESQEAPAYSSYHFSLALSSLIPFAWVTFPRSQCVSPPVPDSWFLGSSYAASGSTPISIQAPLYIAGCDKNPLRSRIPSGALESRSGHWIKLLVPLRQRQPLASVLCFLFVFLRRPHPRWRIFRRFASLKTMEMLFAAAVASSTNSSTTVMSGAPNLFNASLTVMSGAEIATYPFVQTSVTERAHPRNAQYSYSFRPGPVVVEFVRGSGLARSSRCNSYVCGKISRLNDVCVENRDRGRNIKYGYGYSFTVSRHVAFNLEVDQKQLSGRTMLYVPSRDEQEHRGFRVYALLFALSVLLLIIGTHIHIRIYIKQQFVPIQRHTGDTPEAFKNSYSTAVMRSLNMTFWRNATRTMCWRDEKPLTSCVLMMRTEGGRRGVDKNCNGHLLLSTAVSYVDAPLSPLTPFRGVEWRTPFCPDNGRMTFSAMEWMGIQGLNVYLTLHARLHTRHRVSISPSLHVDLAAHTSVILAAIVAAPRRPTLARSPSPPTIRPCTPSPAAAPIVNGRLIYHLGTRKSLDSLSFLLLAVGWAGGKGAGSGLKGRAGEVDADVEEYEGGKEQSGRKRENSAGNARNGNGLRAEGASTASIRARGEHFRPCTLHIFTDLATKYSTPRSPRVYMSLRTAPDTIHSWTVAGTRTPPATRIDSHRHPPFLRLGARPSALIRLRRPPVARAHRRHRQRGCGSWGARTPLYVPLAGAVAGGAKVEDEEDGYEQDEERLWDGGEVSRGRGWTTHRARVQIDHRSRATGTQARIRSLQFLAASLIASGGARRALVDSFVAIARDFSGSVYPLAEEGERKRGEGKGAREKTTTAKGSKRVGTREAEDGKGMWK
ncbi:hypothetical protein B0H14DRAFT_3675553 [Mycena olivaceomarginata]|nr:hypothetical protein B0H14DRAFT_3675553 [Mycena olivaceomarginata]